MFRGGDYELEAMDFVRRFREEEAKLVCINLMKEKQCFVKGNS